MANWEFTVSVITDKVAEVQAELNAAADNNWELVSASTASYAEGGMVKDIRVQYTLFFRRSVADQH